jgi:hypothetical protein
VAVHEEAVLDDVLAELDRRPRSAGLHHSPLMG